MENNNDYGWGSQIIFGDLDGEDGSPIVQIGELSDDELTIKAPNIHLIGDELDFNGGPVGGAIAWEQF